MGFIYLPIHLLLGNLVEFSCDSFNLYFILSSVWESHKILDGKLLKISSTLNLISEQV
jgi:hypothetical protein